MFGRKARQNGAEMGEKIVLGVSEVAQEFERIRVQPLQDALSEAFGRYLDDSIEKNGLDSDEIRREYVKLENAWISGLLEMKPELLEFSEMQDWLRCAEAVGARGMILDSLDNKFEDYTFQLRTLAMSMIGGRVLSNGLQDE